MKKVKILFVFGTRPEAIKFGPLIKEFHKRSDIFSAKVCVTAQHRDMLDQVLTFFKISSAYDLNIIKRDQSLFDITANGIRCLENVIKDVKPDVIFVQGDTTSAFVGALAGFYEKIKIFHIEAGLRSFNKYSPFPEEMNRMLIGRLADLHFAPTINARENLMQEGIKHNVHVVGNTGIDALFFALEIIKSENLELHYYNKFDFLNLKKLILITAHRRESFGKQFKNICLSLKKICINNEDVDIVYPVHLNPHVRKPVFDILGNLKNIHLIEPLSYPEFIWLMNKSYIVLTDSGGIQEEASSLGKPILVMRDVTERIEGIIGKTSCLVGTDQKKITSEVELLLSDKSEYQRRAKKTHLYGDGKASRRIVDLCKTIL